VLKCWTAGNTSNHSYIKILNKEDVTTILSRRAPPYVIKADLPKEARAVESHLLKARWSLIQEKTPKSDIKTNKLVWAKLIKSPIKSGFTPITFGEASDSTSSVLIPKTTTPMDTSNVPTTSAPDDSAAL